jgi:alkanesulfonate monooxygenase SsuD/methylene tetrahydromethanopterin reductase-like flavin-dependent oxidoreductase (luciferase family)
LYDFSVSSTNYKTDMDQPISAMAAVTKNLAFAITASTSFEPPFLLAKRFSTLDHITEGRFGWNIVTSWKKAAFKAIGLDTPIEHDERYLQADEYLRVLYKFVYPETIQSMQVLTIEKGSGKARGPTMQSPRTKRRMSISTLTRSGVSSTRGSISS